MKKDSINLIIMNANTMNIIKDIQNLNLSFAISAFGMCSGISP